MIAWCALISAIVASAEPPTLTGHVMFDGKPAAGAIVVITGASLDSSNSSVWLAKQADLGRWTPANDEGRFSLGVSGAAKSMFAVFFGKEGGTAQLPMPASGEISNPVILTKPVAAAGAKKCAVRVLDEAGKPVAGALVVPVGIVFPHGEQSGGDLYLQACRAGNDGLAQVGYTPEAGMEREILGLNLRIVADGFATQDIQRVAFDDPAKEVALHAGCRVVGKVAAKAGDPGGVWIDLVPAEGFGDTIFRRMRTRTDAQGGFAFDHVPATTEVWIAGAPWDNEADIPAGPIKVKTPANGEKLDAGVLFTNQGRRVAGWVVATDGASLPEGSWITLTHSGAWLGWATPLGKAGSFAFAGVPDGGPYELNVCARGVMLSPSNATLQPWSYTALKGLITRDHVDLKIEVVPFSPDRDDLQPRDKPMRGVELQHVQ